MKQEYKLYGETITVDSDAFKENVSHDEIKHEDAANILFRAKQMLDSKDIRFYLAFGTLLGAVRDKDFIKGDYDVDIIILDEEKLVKNLKNFEIQGLSLIRILPHRLYTFNIDEKCYLDIYVQSTPRFSFWSIYCNRVAGFYIPRKYLKIGEPIDFLGQQFNCVKNPENLLKFWYGETWNIPISKSEKTYYYGVKSYKIYKKIRNKAISFIKIIMGKGD